MMMMIPYIDGKKKQLMWNWQMAKAWMIIMFVAESFDLLIQIFK